MNRIYLRFRSVFMRRRLEREMREEMAAHIASATARNIERGMSPADAARAAQREFGNIDYLQEQARDARGARWVDAVRGDARFALRHFARTPLTTITMIIVLAGGIGVNTALFTVFHSILTSPGPGIPRDESIVRVRGTELSLQAGRMSARGMAYTEVAEYAKLTQFFDGIAASITNDGLATTADRQRPALPVANVYASDNYFALLGVRLQAGRVWSNTPLTADPTTVLIGVISHTVWEAVFDTAADVIGHTFRINDMTVTVAGVAPRTFSGTGTTNSRYHVWLPLAAYALVEKSDLHLFASPDSAQFSVVARLRDGVTPAQTLPTVKAIAQRAEARRTPSIEETPRITSTDVVPLRLANHDPHDGREMTLGTARFGVFTLLILLVTCTNVSSLLVGLAVARRREIAVRLSLGAGRARLIRQLITESTLLAVTAALLASFVTWVLLRLIVQRLPDVRIADTIVFDWRAIGFSVAVALVTGITFGLSPALHATRVALADVLKDAGAAVSGARAWPQRILVVAQITFSQPLLVAVSAIMLLAITGVRSIMTTDVDDRIVIMEFDDDSRAASLDEFRADLARVAERVAAMPGVVGVTRESSWFSVDTMSIHPADLVAGVATVGRVPLRAQLVPPGYLGLRAVPITRGRDFLPTDSDTIAGAVIIDDRSARQLFGASDPIGRRLSFDGDSTYRTIVGVVDRSALARMRGNDDRAHHVFWPAAAPSVASGNELMIRTVAPAEPMFGELRAATNTEVPQLAITALYTVSMRRDDERRVTLIVSSIIGAAGLIMLFLSAISLYAVVSFAVARRTREIGIRTALGAQRRQVVRLFVASGVRLSLLGLIIGLPISLFALRALGQDKDMHLHNSALPRSR